MAMIKSTLTVMALLATSPAYAQFPGYPPGSTPFMVTATGTTAATSATITATSGSVYVCGFSIRANATAAANGNATITGLTGGTMSFAQFVAPLASGIGVIEPVIGYCLPGINNTAVVVSSIAPGAGGNVTVNVWGYRQ